MPATTYPAQPTTNDVPLVVAQQPMAKNTMNATATPEGESPQSEPMRLRGGCPGRFCGLPILPCRCDICIFPIPCC